jgi:hypothetical protein
MTQISVSEWHATLPRALFTLLLSCLFAVLPIGCTTLGTPALSERLQELPAGQKDRVYPFFINSPLDAPQVGRLAGVSSYFRESGFRHSDFLFRSSGPGLADRIREIKQRAPGARIALIAWSGASLWVWDALTDLQESGDSVELIVYLDSNWIKERVAEKDHPANFDRAVLIYRQDNPPVTGVPGSVTRTVATNQHLAVAAHADTVGFLGEELIRLTVN